MQSQVQGDQSKHNQETINSMIFNKTLKVKSKQILTFKED